MTVATYPLGTPRTAAKRGGDCRARDLDQGRNVHGGHRFDETTHCRINNGLLRLTVGVAGVAPSLSVEARRGRVPVEDYFTDIFTDIFPGHTGTPEWLDLGSLVIDSSLLSALLTGVRLVRVTPEIVTIRLVSPVIADVIVSLRRGRRHVDIDHGDDQRRVPVSTNRRVRWTASPSPTGTTFDGRVQEMVPVFDSFPRFLVSDDTVTANAGAFSLTAASSTSATFGAGVGTVDRLDRPHEIHGQLRGRRLGRLVVA